MRVLVLLLYIMYVPFILPYTPQPLLTDRSLLPAPMNTYQAPLLFMARMKSTCQSRSLLCVSSLMVPSSQLLNFVCLPGPPSKWWGRWAAWFNSDIWSFMLCRGTSLLPVLTDNVCLTSGDSGKGLWTMLSYVHRVSEWWRCLSRWIIAREIDVI